MTPAGIKELLGLVPLPEEGGYFCETFRAPQRTEGDRSAGTAIYYLLCEGEFSAMHRLPYAEIFHHYLGDPVEMLLLFPDGTFRTEVLGSDLAAGQRPQLIVPPHVWQGARMPKDGGWGLMGTTVSPGFEFSDFEIGLGKDLIDEWPHAEAEIRRLVRDLPV